MILRLPTRKRLSCSKRMIFCVVIFCFLMVHPAFAFRSSIVPLAKRGQRSSFVSYPAITTTTTTTTTLGKKRQLARTSRTTGLFMFMGSDGGLLGVGTPEVATVLLVGYFVLGPSDLYKLVKEIGKFIQNIRTLGNDLTTSFESNMESQLQLDEIRKAQRELNDAFSFRRTINTNQEEEAFATNVQSERPGMELATTLSPSQSTTSSSSLPSNDDSPNVAFKKKIRRRVKRKNISENNQMMDLEMPTTTTSAVINPTEALQKLNSTYQEMMINDGDTLVKDKRNEYTPEEEAIINSEYEQYISPYQSGELPNGTASWFDDQEKDDDDDITSPNKSIQQTENKRFQQQLSGTWNEQIMEKTNDLAPLAKLMDLLALLEEEKITNEKRLKEEFRERAKNDEYFYNQQRKLLQETIADVQGNAYKMNNKSNNNNNNNNNNNTANTTAQVTTATMQT